MQKLISVGISLFIFGVISSAAFGAQDVPSKEQGLPADSKETAPAKANPGKESAASSSDKTEHNFEDLLVQGKYHFSDEAVTTVEEDKVLDSLLGVRTDFKDKIEQSVGRY